MKPALLCEYSRTPRRGQDELTVRSSSAEARRHHELRDDAGADVASLQERRAAGPAGCQQHRPVPEGEESEGTFTQNCKTGGHVGA